MDLKEALKHVRRIVETGQVQTSTVFADEVRKLFVTDYEAIKTLLAEVERGVTNMTPEEQAAAAMSVFKHAAFDPTAMEQIEAVTAQAIHAATAPLESEVARLRKLCAVRVHCGGCGGCYTYNRADDPNDEGDYGHGRGKCC